MPPTPPATPPPNLAVAAEEVKRHALLLLSSETPENVDCYTLMGYVQSLYDSAKTETGATVAFADKQPSGEPLNDLAAEEYPAALHAAIQQVPAETAVVVCACPTAVALKQLANKDTPYEMLLVVTVNCQEALPPCAHSVVQQAGSAAPVSGKGNQKKAEAKKPDVKRGAKDKNLADASMNLFKLEASIQDLREHETLRCLRDVRCMRIELTVAADAESALAADVIPGLMLAAKQRDAFRRWWGAKQQVRLSAVDSAVVDATRELLLGGVHPGLVLNQPVFQQITVYQNRQRLCSLQCARRRNRAEVGGWPSRSRLRLNKSVGTVCRARRGESSRARTSDTLGKTFFLRTDTAWFEVQKML